MQVKKTIIRNVVPPERVSPYVMVGIPNINHVTKDEIWQAISEISGLSIEQIKSKSRKKAIADSKTISVMALMKFGMSQNQVAKEFLIDHTSVIHHRNKFENYKSNPQDILVDWAKRLREKTGIDILN